VLAFYGTAMLKIAIHVFKDNSLQMNKYISLLLLMLFSYIPVFSQEIPRNIYIGSVNVKIENDARIIIEKEIDNLNANRKYLDATVAKMLIYFPIIERILAEEGIPDEFKYLCVQESGFNPDAISTSGAVGYWQFKKETAQEVGLRVDGVVDERKHLALATKGAAVYLSRNNLILKNWASTLLSYRMGLGAVRRLPNSNWAYKNEITVNSYTDWYVLRFLAHRHFLENEYKRAKNNASTGFLFEYLNTRGKNILDIATELNVSLADVVVNNPWLKSSTVPNEKDYIIYLPVSSDKFHDLNIKATQQRIINNQAVVNKDIGFPVLIRLTEVANKNEPIFYEINGKRGILAVEGDTPESIATRAGVNMKRFLRYNDIDENDRIIPNEVYYLKKKDRKAVVAYHTVEGYETLWKVSQMYGIQLEDLMAKNRITQIQRLQKGRLLWLIDTRSESQNVEYVNVTEDVKPPLEKVNSNVTTIEEKKPVVSQPTQPAVVVVQKPITPKPTPTTQAEITIIESKPETVIVKTKPAETTEPIKDRQPNTPVITDAEIVTTKTTVITTKEVTPITIIEKMPAKIENSTPKVSQPIETSKITLPPTIKNGRLMKNHIVEGKQTYFSISRLYEMSVEEIFQLNGLQSNIPLKIGQILQVYQPMANRVTGDIASDDRPSVVEKPLIETKSPTREVATKPITTPEVAKVENKAFVPAPVNAKANVKVVHTIQAGETLFRVSKLYGVSVEEIREWNGLVDNTVEIGQELKLLTGNLTPNYAAVAAIQKNNITTNNTYKYHVLKAGETVFRVSQLYGVTVEEVVRWNNIKNFAVVTGQKIVIKK
jgi:membrane-bound lytic murein transglycosylase D